MDGKWGRGHELSHELEVSDFKSVIDEQNE